MGTKKQVRIILWTIVIFFGVAACICLWMNGGSWTNGGRWGAIALMFLILAVFVGQYARKYRETGEGKKCDYCGASGMRLRLIPPDKLICDKCFEQKVKEMKSS